MDKKAQNKTDLTPKQAKTIPVILQAKNITEGLELAGISRTTYYEWLKQGSFRDELFNRQQTLVEDALSDLQGLAAEAVQELRSLLRTAKTESTRKKRIQVVLENILKLQTKKSHNDQVVITPLRDEIRAALEKANMQEMS
jgi:hypothetical protein